ncbi:hypothetical protein SAMN04488511_108160 [Pedobacter suwonensis]|uniref:Uncharacterized protein n=1 Tax=Pedobacter suwonensis TaxID=332999 RepID=A0A1I0TCW1_9SPHI|nr:hypothetical protein SAMN04488511_108160 [Pedobacter suwonensis]
MLYHSRLSILLLPSLLDRVAESFSTFIDKRYEYLLKSNKYQTCLALSNAYVQLSNKL